MTTCTHLDHVQITQLPDSVEGCENIPEAQGSTRIPPSPLEAG
jgi:hypothetical protein